ncbi:hypothetical protein [uncultured Tenacibaculum sp.]|uniref:hypothetical protein n=1 Tax=uncultured Tenacibaculum sp. TaxID=174713 RepID=UPI00261EDD77|nr:hypothetical protein [uncultured Tenacibaculum sp.]
MKIRTEKDVRELDEKIKRELGIDVRKYRNEEVVASFSELISLPSYIVSWVIRPILFALLLFIAGYYTLNLVHIEYLIYSIIGLVLYLFAGVSFGLLLLLIKMKKDIWSVVDYTLDIMKSAVKDLASVNNQITEENKKNVLSLLFKGILHIVTIPMFTEIITSKIPIVGFLLSKLLKKVLVLISDRLKFEETDMLTSKETFTTGESGVVKSYMITIESASKGLEKLTSFTFKIARFPIILLFGLSFILLFLFLYLIH